MGGQSSKQQFISNKQRMTSRRHNLMNSRNRSVNKNIRSRARARQSDVVFMPQPPTGAMAGTMAQKTEETMIKSRQAEVEAGIKNIKKPAQAPRVPASISAAKPLAGTQQE